MAHGPKKGDTVVPAERCACGLVSRGLVEGLWRGWAPALVLDTVARTLRTVAFQGLTTKDLINLARLVDEEQPAGFEWACPVCMEITCDTGCPLAEVRGDRRR